MKNSTTRKLIVTMLVMALLSTMLFTIVASGSESGTMTYSMTADEITAFAAGAKADGDSEQLGTDGYFNVFYKDGPESGRHRTERQLLSASGQERKERGGGNADDAV